MFYVPLYIEVLRSRPVLVFWLATLAQAVLWLLVPMLFYAAPPGGLAQLLAVGHEFQIDSGVGPPLAYWLAEIAFRLAGLFGVYVLSQICVIATYWCVFALGRRDRGSGARGLGGAAHGRHLLFTVPTPDFGPPILTMALWAVVLLHYWRAVAQGHRGSWYVLGFAAALMLLASDAALVLLGTLAVFMAGTARGRAALYAIEPWIVAVVLVIFLFLHLLWLEGIGDSLTPTLERLRNAGSCAAKYVGLAEALQRPGPRACRPRYPCGAGERLAARSRRPAPAIVRRPVDPFAVSL